MQHNHSVEKPQQRTYDTALLTSGARGSKPGPHNMERHSDQCGIMSGRKKFALSWAAHVRAVTELRKPIHTGGEDLGQAESTAILGPGEADRRRQHFLALCSGSFVLGSEVQPLLASAAKAGSSSWAGSITQLWGPSHSCGVHVLRQPRSEGGTKTSERKGKVRRSQICFRAADERSTLLWLPVHFSKLIRVTGAQR